MNRQKTITWSLIGLLVLLIWDFGNRALFYHPLSVTEAQSRPAVPVKEDKAPGFKARWGEEIEKKNLFSLSRSARVSPTEAALGANGMPGRDMPAKEQVMEIRPNIILSGIIKNQFGEYVAFLKFDGQVPVGIRKGEALEGVKVIDISKRRVKLNWQGSSFELSLSNQPLIKR